MRRAFWWATATTDSVTVCRPCCRSLALQNNVKSFLSWKKVTKLVSSRLIAMGEVGPEERGEAWDDSRRSNHRRNANINASFNR